MKRLSLLLVVACIWAAGIWSVAGPNAVTAEGETVYVVQAGDGLTAIARKFGTTVAKIVEHNRLMTTVLQPGQLLKVPNPAGVVANATSPAIAPAAGGSKATAYMVKKGDTLFKIAMRAGISVAALQAANGFTGTNIRVGQRMMIPGGAAVAAALPTAAKPATPVAPVVAAPPTTAAPAPTAVATKSAAPAPTIAAAAAPAAAGHGSGVKWAYAGDYGPLRWGSLSPDYKLCDSGIEQSPIDVVNPLKMGLTDIIFKYEATPGKIINNGHTIQVDFAAGNGNTIVVDGILHELLQFHFHAPSEHTIAGASFAMELHLVHKNAGGGLAVVGVMLQPGKASAGLAPVLTSVPTTVDVAYDLPAPVDLMQLLPADRRAYRYPGSLTTPPCSEGVRWILLTNPMDLDTAQIAAYTAVYTGTNRPLQPRGVRFLLQDTSTTN
jgi:carbonic anhydrase